jgi:hypothetical protein
MGVLEGSAAKCCRTLSAFSDYLRPPGPFSFHVWEAEVVISAPAAEKFTPHRKARIAIYAEGRLIHCFDRISAMVFSVIRPCPGTARFRFQKRIRRAEAGAASFRR